jgi:hypothetical protein
MKERKKSFTHPQNTSICMCVQKQANPIRLLVGAKNGKSHPFARVCKKWQIPSVCSCVQKLANPTRLHTGAKTSKSHPFARGCKN